MWKVNYVERIHCVEDLQFLNVKHTGTVKTEVGPVSQICGMLKNSCDYVKVESKAKFCRPISRPSFPPSRTEGSTLERLGALQRAAWTPLELTEGTKRSGAQRASTIQAYGLTGSSRSQCRSKSKSKH
jgi:hypothetical protein